MNGTPLVSVVLPVLHPTEEHVELSKACIRRMRETAGNVNFELIVVETGGEHLRDFAMPIERDPTLLIDKYVHRPVKTRYTIDFNRGIAFSEGDYIVHIGNDVLVADDWLSALLEPFERFEDCGVSTLSAIEPKSAIGYRQPMELISEGMYGPLMMFKREWELDEDYIGAASDNDLVMRLYAAGYRAYRNYSVVIEHKDAQTWNTIGGGENMKHGLDLFYKRWANSPWYMYMLMRKGMAQYGQEHMAIVGV